QQARIVAEQQQRDREEAERKRLEEEAAATAVLGEDAPPIEPDAAAESAAASILGEVSEQQDQQTKTAGTERNVTGVNAGLGVNSGAKDRTKSSPSTGKGTRRRFQGHRR